MSIIKTNLLKIEIPEKVPHPERIRKFWFNPNGNHVSIIRHGNGLLYLIAYGAIAGIIEEIDGVPTKFNGVEHG